MNALLTALTSPDTLEGAAAVVSLVPAPEAPLAASMLKLAATLLRAKKSKEEIDAIEAKYSAEAQSIADGW